MTRSPAQRKIARRPLLAGLGLFGVGAFSACKKPPPKLTVAAASDLAMVMPKIVQTFQDLHKIHVDVTLGASQMLARQLREGAPFDVLALADVRIVEELARTNFVVGDSVVVYARGSLVIVTAEGVALPTALGDLADPRFARIAMANPAFAPYGRAAKQALERSGIWGAVQARIIQGENVQQTLAYVVNGDVQAALVPHSLVGPAIYVVDPALYDPLRQGAGVTSSSPAPETAAAFVDDLIRVPVRDELERAGFLAP